MVGSKTVEVDLCQTCYCEWRKPWETIFRIASAQTENRTRYFL